MNPRNMALVLCAILLWSLAGCGKKGTTKPIVNAPQTRIVFASDRNYGRNEIFLMNSDGTGLTPVTTNGNSNDDAPRWSPDGSRIVFARAYDIYTINPDSSGLVRLTYGFGFGADTTNLHPRWSPTGTKIVFSSDRGGARYTDPAYRLNIYSMNTDGSGVVRLTTADSTFDQGPCWSPDGLKIVFGRQHGGFAVVRGEIYVMNSNGTGLTNLTNNAATDGEPSWSPDGTKIAFSSNRDGPDNIYVMNANGTGVLRLTNSATEDFWPNWSRDGKSIVFQRGSATGVAIYTMNADGTGAKLLTSNGNSPDWGPTR